MQCKYEKKFKMIKKGSYILIFIVLFVFCLNLQIEKNIDSIQSLFKNTSNEFDNSIIWVAITAVLDFFAFLGVIGTLIYTEKLRVKQNKYEFEKEKAIEKQLLFEETLKNQIGNLDPIGIIQLINSIDMNNFSVISNELLKYTCNTFDIDANIYWFYNEEFGGCEKLSILIKEIHNFRESIRQEVLEIMDLRKEFDKVSFNNLKMLYVDEEERKKLNTENQKSLEVIITLKNKSTNYIMKLRENNMNYLQEIAKQVVKERESKVKNIIGLQ